jgi:2'-5' RNA ligase
MPRLFIAIPLADEARREIAAEQQRIAAGLRDAPRRLRWIQPEHMHMTVVFIGAVAAGDVARVVNAVAPPVERPPFAIGFRSLGVFPDRGSPRVLWLGVNEGETALRDLHGIVASRLRGSGIAFDDKPFHPHLTLARWRDSRPADRRAVAALAAQGARASTPRESLARMNVTQVSLYESRAASGPGTAGAGPTYTALSHAALAC